jgi:hypothetical protein
MQQEQELGEQRSCAWLEQGPKHIQRGRIGMGLEQLTVSMRTTNWWGKGPMVRVRGKCKFCRKKEEYLLLCSKR